MSKRSCHSIEHLGRAVEVAMPLFSPVELFRR